MNKNYHGIFVGRFQPLTKMHEYIINKMSKENITGTVFLVRGKKSAENRNKNPFSEEFQIEMIKNILPPNINLEVLGTGYFIDNLNNSSKQFFRVYAGGDRVEGYKKFTKYLEQNKHIEFIEVPRIKEDISATKVREALLAKNRKTVLDMLPNRNKKFVNKMLKLI